MKPLIQKLPLSENASFVCREYRTPYFETPWHQHGEFELLIIREGQGNALIGDYFGEYEPGDVFLLGSNLPHWFRKAHDHQTGSAIVVHFMPGFLGKTFLDLPEMKGVHDVFKLSAQGIKLNGPSKQRVGNYLISMEATQGLTTIWLLLRCLDEIVQAPSTDVEALGSATAIYRVLADVNPIARVFEYTFTHFQQEVSLLTVAELVSMSRSTFCRRFKQSTKRSYVDFLKEVRIGHACKLLTESDQSVLEICYNSGYNNMANFSKQFRDLKQMAPLQYRKFFKNEWDPYTAKTA